MTCHEMSPNITILRSIVRPSAHSGGKSWQNIGTGDFEVQSDLLNPPPLVPRPFLGGLEIAGLTKYHYKTLINGIERTPLSTTCLLVIEIVSMTWIAIKIINNL